MTNSRRIVAGIMSVTDTINRITRYLTYCRENNDRQFVNDMLFSALDTALKLPDMMATLHKLVYSGEFNYAEWCKDIDKKLAEVFGATKEADSWLYLLRNDTFHGDMISGTDKIDEKLKIKNDYLLLAIGSLSSDTKTTVLLRAKVLVVFLLVQKALSDLSVYHLEKMKKQCALCSKIFEKKYKDKAHCSGQDKNEDDSFKCNRYEYRSLHYNITNCCLDHGCFNCEAQAARQSRSKPQALLAKYIYEHESGESLTNQGFYGCIDNRGLRKDGDEDILGLISKAWGEFNAFFEEVPNEPS